MRFAAAPIGDLRFRAPGEPPHVEGIQKADQRNCNVDTVSRARSKLPVWFFIQGGGYAANSNDNFDATEVILQSGKNIVSVQINYRVGPFGFLASDKVQRDGDLNVGLLDQEKALEWDQKYIHLFGGGPDHVVIHGVSAGAGSVAYHLTAHGGKGKSRFVGAIAESPFWPTHRTVADSEFQFAELVSAVDCTDSHDTM
ncbi:alpha/beta-hydrolase [Sarocladium strictum]